MNSSDSDSDEVCSSPDVEAEKINSMKSWPQKSRKRYEAVYQTFMHWRKSKNINSFSESVFVEYFSELSQRFKSSTLWAQYSMLRSAMIINNNINIEIYSKLRALLKCKAIGYRAKNSKTFTPDEIKAFIDDAPDNIYLATKVALIMALMGPCRRNELHSMNMKHIEDFGSAMLVTVPHTNVKRIRKFTLTGNFYAICKKYNDLRPPNCPTTSFFLNYQNGKCTPQNIGINKFGAMGKQVAKFLKLPNPELYTGHSFRKSSATVLVATGGDFTVLKSQDGEWRSEESVAEAYVDDPLDHGMDTTQQIPKIENNIEIEEIQFSSEESRDNYPEIPEITEIPETSSTAPKTSSRKRRMDKVYEGLEDLTNNRINRTKIKDSFTEKINEFKLKCAEMDLKIREEELATKKKRAESEELEAYLRQNILKVELENAQIKLAMERQKLDSFK